MHCARCHSCSGELLLGGRSFFRLIISFIQFGYICVLLQINAGEELAARGL